MSKLTNKQLQQLQTRKAELLKLKKESVELPEVLQNELDDILEQLMLAEQEEQTAEAEVSTTAETETSEVTATTSAYTPAPGTEDKVHLRIVKGRRFNPMTGKEESTPYIQIFSHGEWNLFKNYLKQLGFTIMEVLHDPYNEASKYVG